MMQNMFLAGALHLLRIGGFSLQFLKKCPLRTTATHTLQLVSRD